MPAAIGALFSLSVCSNQSRARSRFVSASADVLCANRTEAQAMGEAYFCCSCLCVWHAVLSITCAGMLCFKPTGLACCASKPQVWHGVLPTHRSGMLCFKYTGLACCASNAVVWHAVLKSTRAVTTPPHGRHEAWHFPHFDVFAVRSVSPCSHVQNVVCGPTGYGALRQI